MPSQKQLLVAFSKHGIFVVAYDAFQLWNVIQLIGQFAKYLGASFSMKIYSDVTEISFPDLFDKIQEY